MTKKRQYKSEALASLHEGMEDLYKAGAIDLLTMKDFDDSCLIPSASIPPEKIKEIRELEKVSQAVFAAHLNVSKNLVSDWERGIKKPGGPALRLLQLVNNTGLKILRT
jgi:putative transcriptional regulator